MKAFLLIVGLAVVLLFVVVRRESPSVLQQVGVSPDECVRLKYNTAKECAEGVAAWRAIHKELEGRQ